MHVGRALIAAAVAGTAAGSIVPARAFAQAAPPGLHVVPVRNDMKPAEARLAATTLADILQANYVFPDIATRYADMLRKNAAAGAYDNFPSREQLAAVLTKDLQSVSPDLHLRVRSEAPSTSPGMIQLIGAPGGPVEMRAKAPMTMRLLQPGSTSTQAGAAGRLMPKAIPSSGWIAPGVAYIRFDVFPPDPSVTKAARRFMAEHASAKTLIIDVRHNFGGGLDQMNAVLPYLFSRQTTLLQMDTRAAADQPGLLGTADSSVMREVPGPPGVVRRLQIVRPDPSEHRLFHAEVYLLISRNTVSAAEHLALALKSTGRATLVGEATRGAGNFGTERKIGDDLVAFIPVGTTSDPRSGARWDGTGVQPDISVSPQRALTIALVQSGLIPADAERVARSVEAGTAPGLSS